MCHLIWLTSKIKLKIAEYHILNPIPLKGVELGHVLLLNTNRKLCMTNTELLDRTVGDTEGLKTRLPKDIVLT